MGQNILTGEQNVTNTLLPTAQNLATQEASVAANPLTLNQNDQSVIQAGPQLLNQQATNAIYGQEQSFLDPQWNQQQQQLQDQLSRQGIPVGSDAYNNAMQQFNNSKTQAYQSAQNQAIAGGSSAASNLFGLASAGQNQEIQQQQIQQQQPLSLLSELFGSTPATPQQPITSPSQTGVAPTDIVGATAGANNAAMQGYQAQLQAQNAQSGEVAGALGTAATAAAVIF